MASKTSTIYLGYLDEQVNIKNQHHLNYTVSKIGGTPNWCAAEYEAPVCNGCKKKLVLILQLYAPLEYSHYHRTLYIFACVNPPCWNRSQSWVCLRSQVLETKQQLSSNTTQDNTSERWMEDEDDWGMPDIDDGNGNICPPSQLVLEYMALKAKALTDIENNTNMDSNLNQRLKNCNTVSEVTKCMENQMNLNEGDSNANESVCGAVGMQGGGSDSTEATAVIEGPEGDMIAVETPEKPTIDIPALFKEVPAIDVKGDVTLVSYFIATGVEPPEDTSFSEHERELFLRYTSSTGHDLKEDDCMMSTDVQGGDSGYEKIAAHHGDTVLHKFKKRILRSPQQILRYCREETVPPLFMRPPALSSIPRQCEYCGGPLIFEAQIMPQLVSYLRVKEHQSSAIEFGTVILYTCSSSCWTEGDAVRLERCYVQAEDI